MEARLPPKWKGLNIKLYDGFTDLDEHMNVYKTQMNLYTTEKSVLLIKSDQELWRIQIQGVWWKASVAALYGWDLGRLKCNPLLV